jgi:hypothetical protein
MRRVVGDTGDRGVPVYFTIERVPLWPLWGSRAGARRIQEVGAESLQVRPERFQLFRDERALGVPPHDEAFLDPIEPFLEFPFVLIGQGLGSHGIPADEPADGAQLHGGLQGFQLPLHSADLGEGVAGPWGGDRRGRGQSFA